MSKIIEHNASKTIKAGTAKYFLNCIYNLPAQSRSLTALFSRNTAKQISISVTDQLTDTNHTRMEHLSLLSITIRSKYLAMGSAWFCYKLITESNQASTSIDRRVRGDWEFPFRSQKSGNKMSVDFGRNVDEKLQRTHQ